MYFIEGSSRDSYSFIVKIIGNQWFWVYELCYENKNINYIFNTITHDILEISNYGFKSEFEVFKKVDIYNIYTYVNFENSL